MGHTQKLTRDQQDALDLHNKQRREAPGGSRPDLIWANTLYQGALSHARKMAETGKQQHDVRNVQLTGQGENLAWGVVDGGSGMRRSYQPSGVNFQNFSFGGFGFPMTAATGVNSPGWSQLLGSAGAWPPPGSKLNAGQNGGNQGPSQAQGWPPNASQAQQPGQRTPKASGGNAGGDGDGGDPGGLSLKDASKMWADEKKDYKGEPIKDASSTGLQGQTGHYTQMVWPEATKMGIAKFTVPPGDLRFKGRGTYVCARYDVCQTKGFSAWRGANGNNTARSLPFGSNNAARTVTSKSGPMGSANQLQRPPKTLSSTSNYSFNLVPHQRLARGEVQIDLKKYGRNIPVHVKQFTMDPNKPRELPNWMNTLILNPMTHPDEFRYEKPAVYQRKSERWLARQEKESGGKQKK